MSRPRTLALAAGILVTLATLTACAPTVALQPADDANAPGCADVIVRLPDTVADLQRRQTDAQSTGAWGSPEVDGQPGVLLRCGVDVPAASTLPCVPLEGVYFLRDDSDPDFLKFTTFGRDPTIDIVVDTNTVPGVVLNELLPAVSFLPTNGLECTDVVDTVTGDELATPAPTPSPIPTP
ncbi:hypothetical protein BH11ACT3_BH11ACT3_08840 [soil metagenome]